jgi:valyl-tRNA synthetase
LSELNLAITDITDSLEKSELGMAADRALDFAWGSYCDWYIELSKKRLYAGDATVRTVLWTVLKDLLKLMHPFMPFITEEIWQSVPGADGNLVVASWPELRQVDQTDLDAMETIMGAIGRIRNLRAEMDLPVGRKGRLYLSGDPRMVQLMKDQTEAFQALASVSEVLDRPEMVENASTILVNQVELTLPLDDLIDYAKEYQRLSKEKDRLEGEIERAKAKLNNPGFVSKAPAQLVENERNKVSEYQEQIVELADKMSLIEDKK